MNAHSLIYADKHSLQPSETNQDGSILVSSMPTISTVKAPGYDDQAPGCSTCASGYGRQNLVSQLDFNGRGVG